MRRVRILPGEQLVEAKLGVRDRALHLQAEVTKARRSDRHEQRRNRLDASGEIGDPVANELRSRQPGSASGISLATRERDGDVACPPRGLM